MNHCCVGFFFFHWMWFDFMFYLNFFVIFVCIIWSLVLRWQYKIRHVMCVLQEELLKSFRENNHKHFVVQFVLMRIIEFFERYGGYVNMGMILQNSLKYCYWDSIHLIWIFWNLFDSTNSRWATKVLKTFKGMIDGDCYGSFPVWETWV